jgi:tetratricopeptide (TPR) repeat protein
MILQMNSKTFRIAAGALITLAAAQVFAADKPTVRPEVGAPLQEAQKALQAKNYKDAKAKIDQAEAVGKLTPYESYIVARLKSSAAIGSGDYKGALSAYDVVLASPELPAAEKLQTLDAYVKIAYASKDYAKTADAIQKYKAAGGNSAETLGLYAQSLYLAGKYKEASTALTAEINEAASAGKRPTDTQLQLLASCALKQNDMVAYTAALEQMVTYSPKKEYWLDLLVRTSHKPGFSDRLDLDMYRLRDATGTLDKADDYMEAAQLSLQAGFPGEAQKFVDKGYAAKLLGAGPDGPRHQRLKDLVTKKIAEDKATLADGEKAAAAQATGDALVSTGFNYVAYGQADKGIALIDQGIKKGGIKAPDQAKLHLGEAYMMAGKKDLAAKTFATVQGTDGSKDIARLWVLQMKAPPAK